MKTVLIVTLKAIGVGFIALVLLMLIAFFFMGRGSANGTAPGLSAGQLAPLTSKPNAVSSEAGTDAGKQVAPFTGVTLAQVKAAIESTGGEVTSETDSYLSAAYTSSVFKFVDDVEVRMEGDTAHIRSASRTGYSDRGVNRARVDAIRAALK